MRQLVGKDNSDVNSFPGSLSPVPSATSVAARKWTFPVPGVVGRVLIPITHTQVGEGRERGRPCTRVPFVGLPDISLSLQRDPSMGG